MWPFSRSPAAPLPAATATAPLAPSNAAITASAATLIGVPGSRYVEFALRPGMTVKAEGGVLLFQTGGVERGVTSIDGGIGRALGRFISGATFFFNTYQGNGVVAFGSSLPGDVAIIRIPRGQAFIINRNSLLATTANVVIGMATRMQGIIGFGQEEGFLLPKLSVPDTEAEDGFAWIAAYGTFREMEVPAGDSLLINNGLFLACDAEKNYALTRLGKTYVSSFFGGEGLGMKYEGPCKVWVQSKNMNTLIDTIGDHIHNPRPTVSTEPKGIAVDVGAGIGASLGAAAATAMFDGGGSKAKRAPKKRVPAPAKKK